MPMLDETDQLVPVDHERLRDRALQALGDADHVLLVGDVLAQHHELVAAEARRRVAAAQALLQAPAERLQQQVADVVAERCR